MGALHHDDVRRAGLGHHLGFEIAAVHRLEVGDDGDAGESSAEAADAVEAFGEDERRAGFEPVDAGAEGHLGGVEGFLKVGEVERDLDNRAHVGGSRWMEPGSAAS